MTRNIMIVSSNIDLIRRMNNIISDEGINLLWEPDHGKIIGHCKIDTFDLLLIKSDVIINSSAEILTIIETLSNKCTVTKIIVMAEPHDLEQITEILDSETYQLIHLPVSNRQLKILITQLLKQRHQIGINLLLEKKIWWGIISEHNRAI